MRRMFEQQPFEHRTGHPLLLGRELAHGLELQAQIIVRAALAVLKQQPIGRHPKALGNLLERLRAGLGGIGLIALDLLHMDAGGIGKALLRQTAFAAQGNRLFVEAVLYRYRSGIPWRDLPERFGDFRVVHLRHSRWSKSGVWERVFKTLSQDPDNEYVMIDSTIVRAHQHSSGAVMTLAIHPG